MTRFSSRLADLEQRLNPPSRGLHLIRLYEGQTEEDATASYEAEHGPMGPDEGILRVLIRKPFAASSSRARVAV